jgi:hypothetical protein
MNFNDKAKIETDTLLINIKRVIMNDEMEEC